MSSAPTLTARHRIEPRPGWTQGGWQRSVSLLSAILVITLAACSPAPVASATPTAAPSTAPASSTTSSATPVPSTPTALAGLDSCPPPQPRSSLPVFARMAIAPDDLLVLQDGTMWVTDPVSGAIVHLSTGGNLIQQIDDRSAPEGMVSRADGSIVLAEQGPNRLVTFTPPSAARTTLLTLPSRGAADGIDGLGVDTAGGHLLIPDSPHGTLLTMPLDGGATTLLASGLGRDVAATIGPNGEVWAAVEGARGLVRIPAGGGTPVFTGQLGQLDDVLTDGGLLYATALQTGEVVAIDPNTGADRVLVTGIGSAQGLAMLGGGRLAVADSSAHVIALVGLCR